MLQHHRIVLLLHNKVIFQLTLPKLEKRMARYATRLRDAVERIQDQKMVCRLEGVGL